MLRQTMGVALVWFAIAVVPQLAPGPVSAHLLGLHTPAAIQTHPQRVPIRVAPIARRSPGTTDAGTVTTIIGNTSQYLGAAYDPQNKSYYLIAGEILDQLSNGQISRLTNFFAYSSPTSIVWDSHSGVMYVTIPFLYEILQVTTGGSISLLAGGTRGTNDGTGAAAQFVDPGGIALDSIHNVLYVVDNDRLRAITESGVVTTVGPLGFFNNIGVASVTYDSTNGDVAIDSVALDDIILYQPVTNTYKTLAGRCIPAQFPNNCLQLHQDGRGKKALFAYPSSITYDAGSDSFYIADWFNYEVRKVDASGNVTTFAGSGAPIIQDGIGLAASFGGPDCTTINSDLDELFVCDYGAQRLATLSGPPAPPPSNAIAMQPTKTLLSSPSGITSTSDGSVWYGEGGPGYIARIFPTGKTTEFALPARYAEPNDLATDSAGNIWFEDAYAPNNFGQPTSLSIARMRTNGAVSEVPLTGTCGFAPQSASSLTPDATGDIWFASNCPSALGQVTAQLKVRLFSPTGLNSIVIAPDGTLWGGAQDEIYHFNSDGSIRATYTGLGLDAGIAWGSDGSVWFLSNGRNEIGTLNPSTGVVVEFQLPPCGCNGNVRGLGDLKAGPDGALWFTEGYIFGSSWFYGGVGHVTTAGTFTEFRTYEPRSQPTGLTFDLSGRMWTADGGANKVGHL
ncbi:MAG TPA: hypothetical protein VFO25_00110 [Candidatus Eremiobacteraceae bacterium]|nr:hypothetical protein [Candidatus Eremiobacteraceae bacterium]